MPHKSRKQIEISALIAAYKLTIPSEFQLAVSSIINQTIPPSEIIIVFDGPVPSEIEKFARSVTKIHRKIVKLKDNIGLGAALKIGVENCSCPWILRMDDDDYSFSDRIEKQVNFLQGNTDVDVLGGSIIEFEPHSKQKYRRSVPTTDGKIKKTLRFKNPFNHVTILAKKQKILSVGNYCNDIVGYEDYVLWAKMFKEGATFANLDEDLVEVKFNKAQVSRRRGIRAIYAEIKMQRFLLGIGVISFYIFMLNLITKIPTRMLPTPLLFILFQKFLRNPVKKNG